VQTYRLSRDPRMKPTLAPGLHQREWLILWEEQGGSVSSVHVSISTAQSHELR